MRNMFKHRAKKKGSIQDVMFILVTLVVLACATLLSYRMMDSVNTKLQESSLITVDGKAASDKLNNMYSGVIDQGFLLLFVGLCIGAMALATMVRIHPIFFLFFIILVPILIVLGGVFSNMFQKMADNPQNSALADKLTGISYIMEFLPFIIGVVGFIISIIMYKSWQNA